MEALRSATELYPERAVLRDGRAVVLRPITPAAKPLIAAALRRLSPESSRRRFFTLRYRLSDTELERMTHLDGVNQYALGATGVSAEGQIEGVGVARFVRIAGEPRAAEAAVTVIDEYHGNGLGTLLLRRLAAAALARGIESLRGIVLHDNDPMIGLLSRHAPGLTLIRSREHLEVDVRLDPRKT